MRAVRALFAALLAAWLRGAIACNEGEWLDGGTTCRSCDSKYFCPDGIQRIPCDPGYFCAAGVSSQSLCEKGSYCPTTNASITCQSTQYCKPGSIFAAKCPAGYYCPDPGTKLPCRNGSYCPAGSVAERSCPAGYFCPRPSVRINCTIHGHSSKQIIYDNKTYIISNQDSLEAAVYCPENSTFISACPAGYYCPNATWVVECYAPSHIEAVHCPRGVHSSRTCQEGYYCPHSSMEIPCETGDYCPRGAHERQTCPQGSYCETPNSMKSCGVGYWCPPSSVAQMICPESYYCPANGTKRRCPNGGNPAHVCLATRPPENATAPTVCPAGHYCASPISIDVCETGDYCPFGSGLATDCPAGHTCPTPSTIYPCNQTDPLVNISRANRTYDPYTWTLASLYCPARSSFDVFDDDARYAHRCSRGYFCPNSTTQIVCGRGYFCPEGVWDPIVCPAGSVCPDGESIVTCSPGELCLEGSYTVSQCPTGYSCPNATRKILCTPGQYCPRSTGEARNCAVGTYCKTTGQEQICPCGTLCPERTTSPLLCPAGSYCQTPAASVKCIENHYCPEMSTQGAACPPNSKSPAGSAFIGNCTCDAGFEGTLNSVTDACVPATTATSESRTATITGSVAGAVVGSVAVSAILWWIYCRKPNQIIPEHKIELLEKLGQGNFAKTYKARYGRRLVAIKIPIGNSDMKELESMLGLREKHRNVMEFVGIAKFKGKLCFVTKLYEQGSLDGLHTKFDFTTRNNLYSLVLDVCQGAAHLHSKGIVHRDIRCANVLIGGDLRRGRFVAALGDWGLARTLGNAPPPRESVLGVDLDDLSSATLDLGKRSPYPQALDNSRSHSDAKDGVAIPYGKYQRRRTYSRTSVKKFAEKRASIGVYTVQGSKCPWPWTAPEAVLFSTYSKSADVYMIGVLMWEVLTRGRPPYDWERAKSPKKLMFDILAGSIRLRFPPGTPAHAEKLAKICLSPDPDRRPGSGQLVEIVTRIKKKVTKSHPEAKLDCVVTRATENLESRTDTNTSSTVGAIRRKHLEKSMGGASSTCEDPYAVRNSNSDECAVGTAPYAYDMESKGTAGGDQLGVDELSADQKMYVDSRSIDVDDIEPVGVKEALNDPGVALSDS